MKDQIGNCAEFQVEIISGNVFIRPIRLEKKSDFVDGHKHTYDHTTMFDVGKFHINLIHPDGSTSEQDAISLFQAHFDEIVYGIINNVVVDGKMTQKLPFYFLIDKDTDHEIISTTDTYEEVLEKIKDKGEAELRDIVAKLGSGRAWMKCVYSHRNQNGEVIQESRAPIGLMSVREINDVS